MFKKDRLLKLSLSSHSPHQLIPDLIKPGSIVLDVGCNSGFLGKKLKKEKNILSDGVDIDNQALKEAKKYYRSVYKRDLYTDRLNLNKNTSVSTYDYIIFADILEHLPRPDLVLQDARGYLKKNGKIIASIPNIARLEIRLKLLFGNFDYTEGILSQDHLRFFTKKTATKMFQHCGYKVEKILPTGFGHIIKIFPTLTAFQFIYVCSRT